MSRVKIEYAKAVVMALCALALLAIGILARTFDAASLTIMFSALVGWFVLRGRALARLARGHGCGPTPRP